MMVDLEFYSTRSLKQQSLCRYAALFGHDIHRLRTNRSVFVRTNKCYVLNREAGNFIVIVFAHSSHQC